MKERQSHGQSRWRRKEILSPLHVASSHLLPSGTTLLPSKTAAAVVAGVPTTTAAECSCLNGCHQPKPHHYPCLGTGLVLL
ncbi:hypothetical protein PIB30_017204 [Stylosanthes scabra]|uniref:Uncharacterized protein n=1 Tax=Stylosanthes scabra TaxID=79078 RepID=A0ABU6Y4L2_9FABA|nr:hypothetical protein [Stylosanthes scabra]